MSRSRDYSGLAGSLATVAIAALGGPLSFAAAVLTEVVKLAQARYEAGAPMRDLHRQVTTEIERWADGAEFTREEVKQGLRLAAETVARSGLDEDAIATLNFNPEAVSKRVLAAAKVGDRYWGSEDHYEVAERGIAVTYRALIGQMRGKEPVLIPAVRALRDTLDEIAARVESTHAKVEDLAAAQIAPGTVLEVMAYLRARTADWDTSVWHGDEVPQSAIERRLRVRLMGRDPSLLDREMNAAEAAAGQRLLVVVGGPGSGKTWLARRYAREASQAALSKLEGGAGLDEVELPLFTTWDQWRKTPGGTRESLVAASFASGLGQGDLGGETTRRLQRTFTERRENVLLVLDALDEAADLEGQSGRLRELTSMGGWRVVVTSRHAAWDATFRGDRNRADGLRVVELQDLEYPSDVNTCIGAWFAADPSRGDALIEQIRTRDDLRRGAVVPLMLTFYCLLAEESDTVRPLPLAAASYTGAWSRDCSWAGGRPALPGLTRPQTGSTIGPFSQNGPGTRSATEPPPPGWATGATASCSPRHQSVTRDAPSTMLHPR